MKLIRGIIKTLFFVLLGVVILVFSGIIYIDKNVDDNYRIKSGESLQIDSIVPVTVKYKGAKASKSARVTAGEQFEVEFKAFGIIPISTAQVEVVDKMQVAVLGTPFGMKIYTKGVLVSDFTDVKTKSGNKNPAKSAGLKKGDYIVSVNGKRVATNEDVGYIVENSNGEKMQFEVLRGNTTIYFNFAAVKEKESKQYKIGIWVKDSSAGIGTLTFYSPSTNILCGLGHGICDDSSKKLLNINSGEVVAAQIISVTRGRFGEPGQLKGRFNYKSLGNICLNSDCGVFSVFDGDLNFTNLTEVALKQEVKNGKAEIYCTIDGDTPKYYACNIEVRKTNYDSTVQNLLVTVTDRELLQKTGGIVQGMSGSPIMQNGKLVGAVTHVLIDDPTKGYGIFAENMLETAQSVAEENKLKDAS